MAKNNPAPASAFPALNGLVGQVGFGAFLLALVLAPVIGGFPSGGTYEADVSLNALRALVFVAGACLSFLPSRPESGTGRFALYGLWAVAALTLLSLLVHSAFLTSPVLLFALLPAALDWLAFAFAAMLAARLVRHDGRALVWIIGAIVLGAAWVALRGALDYGQLTQAGLRGQRIQATFFSPNFAAGFLALCLPLVAVWTLVARERLAALALGTVGALMLGALAATGSRAGIALAALGLVVSLVLLAFSAQKGTVPWTRLAVFLAACAALGFGFRGPLTLRAQNAGQEQSGQFRRETWKGTLAMARANPVLGTGPGTFPYRYPAYSPVEKTDLAHSSYLQLAAEQGSLAFVCALATIALALFGGLAALWKTRRTSANTGDILPRLLLCGLIGSLLAGAARSVFDSEWSLLGNALPFWTLAGLAAADFTPVPSPTAWGQGQGHRKAMTAGGGSFLALAFSLLLLRNAQIHDAAQMQVSQGQPPAAARVWPPDPDLLYWNRQAEEAARVEPTTKRFYRLGRQEERSGNAAGAVRAFREAAAHDPHNLQSLRALAEALEKSGDAAGATAAWRELAAQWEGPAGTIRAIPEMTETHAAYAYAALAKRETASEAARADYQKAAQVIEDYARTPPVYQQMEAAIAGGSGIDLKARRNELRALYENVQNNRLKMIQSPGEPARAERDKIEKQKAETLALFDTLALPDGPAAGSGPAAAAGTPSPIN